MRTFILSLLLASSLIHASCGELDIKIINDSNQNCILKDKDISYGFLLNKNVPSEILSGQSGPVFTAKQNSGGVGVGIGILLTYMCGNELVKFYSWQSHCNFLTAPLVGVQPYKSPTLNLSYYLEPGDYWADLPGKITWRIM